MTESDWLASARPREMLTFLADRASDRKLRLFGVACCRVPYLLEEADRRASDLAERRPSGRDS